MLTIPNLISVIRLGLIPVFLWLLLARDNPFAAGWLLGGIAATDWVDGYLARRLDQVSEVGKFLDPLADRIAIIAAVIGGLISGYLPSGSVAGVIDDRPTCQELIARIMKEAEETLDRLQIRA